MSIRLDRRALLKAGTVGLGALAFPGAAQPLLMARGFTHNVASGEPGADRAMLWTRYVPHGRDNARLSYRIARDADFRQVVGEGSVTAEAQRDWTVKPVVTGLPAGQWLYYRFEDATGRRSPTGRTRTLPAGPTERFKIGIFSCSNLPFGWFNAYGHASARDDLDLILHLGDYLYEYRRGDYPGAAQMLDGRIIEPAGEIVQLADYRLRYASYRADPDLQELHRRFPMAMMWDDHESANDAWRDGAENHDEGEGDWAARKAIAVRAAREWLPLSDETWTSYEIGDLATLFRPETRLTGRDRQLDLTGIFTGTSPADLPARLAAFRDTEWRNPARSMLGAEQERWLADGLRRSAASGRKWQVLGQQVIMGQRRQPPEIAQAAPMLAPDIRRRVEAGALAAQAGLPLSFDMWDGYPAARSRLLQSAVGAGANMIVLSGDSHNAWAFDIDHDGAPAAVEFAGHSVTSPGFEGYLPQVPPTTVAQMLVRANPQLKWADTGRRGYLTLELTRTRATGEFLFLDTIRRRSHALSGTHRMSVAHGHNRLEPLV